MARDSIKNSNFASYNTKVLKLEKNKILLKGIVIDNMTSDGRYNYGYEDHINILDETSIKAFKNKNIQKGDNVSFLGEPYVYTRKDGTRDYSLKNIIDIQKIEDYEIPNKEELIDQQIQQLVCETCMFYEKCNFCYCMANKEEKEKLFTTLKNLQPNKFTVWTVLAAYEFEGKIITQEGSGLQLDIEKCNNSQDKEIINKILNETKNWPICGIIPWKQALAMLVYPEIPRIYFD